MMTSNINFDFSPICLKAMAINKTILELSIEKLEDEILAFEDAINYAIQHPEKAPAIPFRLLEEKASKLSKLQEKLAALK